MESGSSHPPPETTPSDRVRSEQQALKKRVEVVDPNESRCVILNNDDITDVKYTRYFNGQFMDDEMMVSKSRTMLDNRTSYKRWIVDEKPRMVVEHAPLESESRYAR